MLEYDFEIDFMVELFASLRHVAQGFARDVIQNILPTRSPIEKSGRNTNRTVRTVAEGCL